MVLRGLQSLLGRLYDVELNHDVYDFLVTNREHVSQFTPHNDRRLLDETLLLAEMDGDSAGVALYLDPQLLKRLEGADPVGTLDETNIADYCTALEGVSHFVYSTWRLERNLPVSLLELETQAEVDKYAVTVFLVAGQQSTSLRGMYPTQVHSRLFDKISFDPALDADLYERYSTAHRCAARYCRQLERRYVSRGVTQLEGLVRELRTFYRLGAAAKMRHALA